MRRATLRGLMAHKLRLFLATLAVVLGVAFVSGTLVLSDTLNHSFDNLFAQTTAGVDVAVQGVTTVTDEDRPPVNAGLLDRVRSVDGVEEAFGVLQRNATTVGTDGKEIRNGGAPTFGFLWNPYPDLAALHLKQGAPPHGEGEVVVDAKTAGDHGLRVGDSVRIELPDQQPRSFNVSGIAGFGDQDNLLGATISAFDASVGPGLLGAPNEFDSIEVKAQSGVSPDTLRNRIAHILPAQDEAITGTSLAQQETDLVSRGIGFLTTFLLVFAGVALLVGSFIILNTFSILVAQRQKELALLRCLGATRAQVMRSVLLEALITGTVASVIGMGLGVALSKGLQALLAAVGISITGTSLQFQARTVVWSLVVGIGVTVVASVFPARKATRVAPVEAMRDSVPPTSVISVRRVLSGIMLTAAGIVVLCLGLFVASSNQLSLTGLGAVLIFLGVAVLAAVIARPVVRVLGWPVARTRGIPGRLARQNARRQPRRTASTASALMIGVGLVACFAVFAASLKDSTNAVLDRTARADYILTASTFSNQGLNRAVVDALRADTRSFGAISPISGGRAKIDGHTQSIESIEPTTADAVMTVEVEHGQAISRLADDEVAISEAAATSENHHVGETLSMQFPRPGTHQQRVVTIYSDNPLLGDYLVTDTTWMTSSVRQGVDVILVRDAPGTSADAARQAIDRALGTIPGVKVQSRDEYKSSQASQINALLGVLYALLGLALIIALLGIVNTLVLSIVERTRELGLVRALGMEKRQMRTMVRWESVIIAMFGTLLGIVVGVGFGAALVRSASAQGVSVLTIPGGQLVAFVVMAVLFGLLAAIFPARRAASVDMLQAITTE